MDYARIIIQNFKDRHDYTWEELKDAIDRASDKVNNSDHISQKGNYLIALKQMRQDE